MKTIIAEIKELFRAERLYFYLLVALVTFYAVILVASRMAPDQLSRAERGLQMKEAVWKETPQAPHEFQARWSERAKVSWTFKISNYLLMAAIGLGIWLSSKDLYQWYLKKEVIPPSAKFLNIGWGISEVVKVVILFILCGTVVNIGFVIVKFLYLAAVPGSILILAQAFVLDVIAVFLMVGVIRKHGSALRDLLGFDVLNISLREIWLGARTYFVILPIFFVMLILMILAASWLRYEPPPHPLVGVFLKEGPLSPWLIAASMLLACFIGPVVEEIFFRGFLYPALRRYWGIPWSMVVTAGLFAAVHENLFAFIPIFFLGLVLAYLYQKRDNLVPCISLHVMHNVAFITYFFLIKSALTG
ncbi:MAG: hypothetical protein A3G87_07870 [Omnitrophica bacterium RIFCSPLOWO2_12_FULL_50_11]|nr:MAG: hypothetical protein A3G87_07870 [Omnitrophica bacterium RIFCSPLOWO2_12_FULL_50_11]